MNHFLGGGKPLKEPPKGLVHLIVTAGRKEQQQVHRIERDTLPDLVLKMHESEVPLMIGRYTLLMVNVLHRLSCNY